jgi:hypothetical protein
VSGDRPVEELDETSQKILAATQGPGDTAPGTSIFDPVVCELVYRWFSPLGGRVFDPFAGGSVRGVVAAILGREYVGIDLRSEQVEANEGQRAALIPDLAPAPRWVTGSSEDVEALLDPADRFDLVFSCPPYGDLERYSDDPRDLSTMDHSAFLTSYRAIIAASVARLHEDRFAVFVVGDYRDRRGFYANFVAETIADFEAAGARLYNEAVLVTAVGSLSIRAGRQFAAGRKLGKTHQNILVFWKGDPSKIREVLGDVDVTVPEILADDDPDSPQE